MHRFEYHVLMSFAGEDRPAAERLARILRRRGLLVFYDEFERSKTWGEDLIRYFSHLYCNAALFCVVLLSKHYRDKRWTRLELRSALERAFIDRGASYILPIRLDDTNIDGIPQTIGYLENNQFTPTVVADLICKKVSHYLRSNHGATVEPDSASVLEGRRSGRITFGERSWRNEGWARPINIGINAALVRHAEWIGDDLEMILSSTEHEEQDELVCEHLDKQPYMLGIDGVRTVLLDNGLPPTEWIVSFNTRKLTNSQVVNKLRQIVKKHNEIVNSLLEAYYSDHPRDGGDSNQPK